MQCSDGLQDQRQHRPSLRRDRGRQQRLPAVCDGSRAEPDACARDSACAWRSYRNRAHPGAIPASWLRRTRGRLLPGVLLSRRAPTIAFASGGGTPTSAHEQFPRLPAELQLAGRPVAEMADSVRGVEGDFAAGHRFAQELSRRSRMNLPTGDLNDSGGSLARTASRPGSTPSYSANAYNPYLKPTSAWQYDLSLENYFANVGQFSVAAFYKKFNNYIQYGIFRRRYHQRRRRLGPCRSPGRRTARARRSRASKSITSASSTSCRAFERPRHPGQLHLCEEQAACRTPT